MTLQIALVFELIEPLPVNQLRTRLLRLQRLLEEDRQKERSDQMVHAVDSVAAEDELVSSTTYPIYLAGPSCGILRHVC